MFGLFRLAVWGALVLLILPIGHDDSGNNIDIASPVEAVSAVREAIGDLSSICERKPDLCDKSQKLAETLSSRAREAARMAYEALGDNANESQRSITTGSVNR